MRRAGEAQVRAFFGVEVGQEARDAAWEVAQRMRAAPGGGSVRWVRTEGYHLTLRFLGSVAADAVTGLSERAAAAVAPLSPFTLQLGGLEVFPSLQRPRVAVLAVAPEAPLHELAARVEQAVVAAGLPAEPRPFRAHLTLGRVRRGERPRLVAEPPVPARFEVAEVVLFRSDLGPGGSLYTPLARLSLAGVSRPRSDSPSATRARTRSPFHGQARAL